MTILYRNALIRSDGEGRSVYGLAMPFEQEAEIYDPGESYREKFVYGAFTRTIAERGHKVKLLANHDYRQFPVGKPTMLEERDDGLHVAFDVVKTRDGDDVLELVRSGTVDSFSIGFIGVRERREKGVRVRTEVSLREVSLVGFPAFEGAVVAGVRSAHPFLSTDLARRRLELLLKSW